MAAYAARGYTVQPFKCGPDFLDGMHHEAAVRAGTNDYNCHHEQQHSKNQRCEEHKPAVIRKSVNLDAWMMGSPTQMIASFHRHSHGADICILEGVMGLHDSKDGISDEGSTAQIARLLGVPVVLVIDGSKMARSVAAMALGYTLMDAEVRVGAVVANRVGGVAHKQWIREAVEHEGREDGGQLKDCGTGKAVMFAGAVPNDSCAKAPERYLGLVMPSERTEDKDIEDPSNRFLRLATLVEENLDLHALLQLAQSSCTPSQPNNEVGLHHPPQSTCRIAIAEDAAFCFYYRDNLHLLQMAGAELVPFSPLSTPHLPPNLDGIYMGGGYPELHAEQLEKNASLRKDIKSFSEAGGVIFAECGGFMYLADKFYCGKDEPAREMCGVFPIAVRMTSHCNMYYADIEFGPLKKSEESQLSMFPAKGKCRGQRFHYSEVVDERDSDLNSAPLLVTPVRPGAKQEGEGYSVRNTIASYFHLHFSSFTTNNESSIASPHNGEMTLADHFVQAAIAHSPCRKAHAVSFVSAATEIIL